MCASASASLHLQRRLSVRVRVRLHHLNLGHAHGSLTSYHAYRLLALDRTPLSEQHVSDVLQAAFDASDGSVATIGDIVRAAAAAVPRDCVHVHPQFLSTLALDSIHGTMLRTVAACAASTTANAPQLAANGQSAWVKPLFKEHVLVVMTN